MPGVEVLGPLVHFDAVLEPDDGNLHGLVMFKAVGLDVDCVEVGLEEAFSLDSHSVGLGRLVLPFMVPESINVYT